MLSHVRVRTYICGVFMRVHGCACVRVYICSHMCGVWYHEVDVSHVRVRTYIRGVFMCLFGCACMRVYICLHLCGVWYHDVDVLLGSLHGPNA